MLKIPVAELHLHPIRPAAPSLAFVESVRDNGILHPIHVAVVWQKTTHNERLGEEGETLVCQYHTVNGHQRIAAAIAAELEVIPAVMVWDSGEMPYAAALAHVAELARTYQSGDTFSTPLERAHLYHGVITYAAGATAKERSGRALAKQFSLGRGQGEVLTALWAFVSATLIPESGGRKDGKWDGAKELDEQMKVALNVLVDFAARVPFDTARVKGAFGSLWAAWRGLDWRKESVIAEDPSAPRKGSKEDDADGAAGGAGGASKSATKADKQAPLFTPSAPLPQGWRPATRAHLDGLTHVVMVDMTAGLSSNDERSTEQRFAALEQDLAGVRKGVGAGVALIPLDVLHRLITQADTALRQQALPFGADGAYAGDRAPQDDATSAAPPVEEDYLR